MKFDIDLKTLIMILSISCALGGFYYSTNIRLDNAEARIKSLDSQLIEMRVWSNEVDKKIKNLQRRINKKEK
tara:strand:+ start:4690 stop:4905 length:216 start_codon:yes stop_codon:yes gene_type:complete